MLSGMQEPSQNITELLVSYGRGRGVVISTGMNTQIGMIAEMLQSVQLEPTPLQRRLDQLGKTLGWAALAVCAIVFFVGWIQGSNPLDMFMIAVSLAIAAVPEGLPAIVTISLALGMREMIKRHALIRRLASVETLGSATTICSIAGVPPSPLQASRRLITSQGALT